MVRRRSATKRRIETRIILVMPPINFVRKSKYSFHFRILRTCLRRILCILLLAALPMPSPSQQALATTENNLIDAANTITVGDALEEVSLKLAPVWTHARTNQFILKPPFSRWIPWTNSSALTEWHSKSTNSSGWPSVLFVLFGTSQKTNVVDALLCNGPPPTPVVDGLFNRRLLGIKKGDSIEDAFRWLGKRDCEYFRKGDGRWHVEFLYYGNHGEMMQIVVDAATGQIESIVNSAL